MHPSRLRGSRPRSQSMHQATGAFLRSSHTSGLPCHTRSDGGRLLGGRSWLEVTHCGGAWNEQADSGSWHYAVRGSGLFVNVGRTRAFEHHADAVRHFWGANCSTDAEITSRRSHDRPLRPRAMVSDAYQCDAELPRVAREAAAAGYDSIQFTRHCDLRCSLCGHELVMVRDEPWHPEQRTGLWALAWLSGSHTSLRALAS